MVGGILLGPGAAMAAPFWIGAAVINLAAMVVIGLPTHLLLKKRDAATGPNYSMWGFLGGALVGWLVSKLGIPIGNGTAPAFGVIGGIIAFAGGVWGFCSASIAFHILNRSASP